VDLSIIAGKRSVRITTENPVTRLRSLIQYLSPMKTATVADLRNNFATISKWIHDEEVVTISKRGFHFATLTPTRKRGKVAGPLDRMARLRKLFPNGPVADSQAVLDYDRGDLGTRSLDLLHVAAALEARCTTFASFDESQRKCAALARLKVIPERLTKRH